MTCSKKECVCKIARGFLASFILMAVFLLPYFAYIFKHDIPFSHTTYEYSDTKESSSSESLQEDYKKYSLMFPVVDSIREQLVREDT